MIYTLTLNPSLDYIMRMDSYKEGKTNRTNSTEKYAGGKGINVSKLLKNLDMEACNLGFVGGFVGDYIKKSLDFLGINHDFVEIKDETRINVKIKSETETEINAEGPFIEENERKLLLEKIEKIGKNDLVVISGSLPRNLNKDYYKEIVENLYKRKIRFALDLPGDLLLDLLEYRPLLVKPNLDEVEEIFAKKASDEETVLQFSKKLVDMGAENVILSLGKEGSVFADESSLYRAKSIKGQAVNSVGAGDSMLAGFIYGLKYSMSKLEAYKLAVAAATASAFSKDIGEKSMIYKFLQDIEIERS